MTLSEIIERLEKADGRNRELDCYIWVAAKGGDARMHYISDSSEFVWERGIDGMWIRAVERFKTVPAFTSSVDAAIALAEKVLPGEPVNMGWAQTTETRPWARVGIWSAPDATGLTPAIALVLAILSALRAKQEGNQL